MGDAATSDCPAKLDENSAITIDGHRRSRGWRGTGGECRHCVMDDTVAGGTSDMARSKDTCAATCATVGGATVMVGGWRDS